MQIAYEYVFSVRTKKQPEAPEQKNNRRGGGQEADPRAGKSLRFLAFVLFGPLPTGNQVKGSSGPKPSTADQKSTLGRRPASGHSAELRN